MCMCMIVFVGVCLNASFSVFSTVVLCASIVYFTSASVFACMCV